MITQLEVPSCPICYEELQKQLVVTQCGHVYHNECIQQSLARSPHCPLCRKDIDDKDPTVLQYSLIERTNIEVTNFFDDLPDSDKKSVKNLSCKLVQQINLRSKAETQLNLTKNQNDQLLQQVEELKSQMADKDKQQKKQQVEMNTLRTQNEYKVFLADSVEKDKKYLEQDKLNLINELTNLRKINSIAEQLAKVENKAQWANSIRRTQSIQQQAEVFYETYRLQLTKEEELKDKNERLKAELKEIERKSKLYELTLVDKKKTIEKLKFQLVKVQQQPMTLIPSGSSLSQQSNSGQNINSNNYKAVKNQTGMSQKSASNTNVGGHLSDVDDTFENDLNQFLGEAVKVKNEPPRPLNLKKRKLNQVDLNFDRKENKDNQNTLLAQELKKVGKTEKTTQELQLHSLTSSQQQQLIQYEQSKEQAETKAATAVQNSKSNPESKKACSGFQAATVAAGIISNKPPHMQRSMQMQQSLARLKGNPSFKQSRAQNMVQSATTSNGGTSQQRGIGSFLMSRK